MDRRDFLAKAGIAATWAGIAISVSACGDDGDAGMEPDGGGDGGVTGSVGSAAGHSHSGATITDVQLMEGNAVSLTLTGAGHTHTANLSAQQVTMIAAGTRVSVTSVDNSGPTPHEHTVTFN
ncbi:MAG TPA: twin-arginine translocation signal domain-containing protein [bacterium]|nr:twin-arginine translocation signal domain-containing protein [bacterium]